MITELIPAIDSTYRTLTSADHRAMAGLSMGSGQALQITLKHLDKFTWIGAISGPARNFGTQRLPMTGVFLATPQAFNRKVKLLWLGAGTAETQVFNNTQPRCMKPWIRRASRTCSIHLRALTTNGRPGDGASMISRQDCFRTNVRQANRLCSILGQRTCHLTPGVIRKSCFSADVCRSGIAPLRQPQIIGRQTAEGINDARAAGLFSRNRNG